MARLQVVSYTLTCDVCGAEIPDSDAESASRTVSWDGAEFALDLCEDHRAELGEALGQLKVFVDAGDRVASRGRRAGKSSGPTGTRGRRAATAASSSGGGRRSDVAAIRSWAKENGYKVGDRARIAGSIMAAYDEAHTSLSPPAKRRGGRKAPAV